MEVDVVLAVQHHECLPGVSGSHTFVAFSVQRSCAVEGESSVEERVAWAA